MRSKTIVALVTWAALLAAAAVGAQQRDPWAGVYRGDGGQVLVLRRDGAQLSGTWRSHPQPAPAYPLRVEEDGAQLVCTYRLILGEIRFRLRRTAGGAVAKFARHEIELRRMISVAELLAARERGAASGFAVPALADLGAVRHNPHRRWTILCYLAADNDLEAAALADLQEMLRGLPRSGVEVVALLDRAMGYATPSDPTADWTDARLFHIHRATPDGKVVGERIASPGELDMGDPGTLASFVAGALKAFPAERRMLVMWDHGGGWVGQCLDVASPRGVMRSELSLVEVREGIEQGLAGAGVERFDVIGFDECLMAQLETAVELSEVGDYLLASEAVEPGYGWPYDDLLPLFAADDELPDILAKAVDAFAASYAQRDAGTTLSVLDLRKVGPFLRSFEQLLEACGDGMATDWPRVARSLYYGESYAGREDVRRGARALASVDLFDVMMRLRLGVDPFPAPEEFDAFAVAHRQLVLHNRAGPSRRFSHGVSIYAPPTAAQWNDAYRGTRLGARPGWSDFLAELHRLAAADRTPLEFTGGLVTSEFGEPRRIATPLAGDALQATLRGNNVIWTRLLDCTRLEDGALWVHSDGFVIDSKWLTRLNDPSTNAIDRMMPVYQDGVSVLRHELHGVGFMVTDGRLSGRATMYWSKPDAKAPLAVPARYEHPDAGGFSNAEIQFDPITWQATRVVAFVEQAGGQLVPRVMPRDQGGEVILMNRILKPDGTTAWQRGTFLRWSSDLRLVPDAVAIAGDRVAVLTAETMSGREATTQIPYRMGPSRVREQWRASWEGYRPGWFTGTWEQDYMDGQGQWRPLHWSLAATPQPGERDRYRVTARFRPPGRPAAVGDHRWVLYPDSGAIRIVARGLQGGEDEVYWGPVHLQEDGVFVAKMIGFGGVLWRFRRSD